MPANISDIAVPKSGYDLPVYGLDDGTFYVLHIIAITCLSTSITCVVITTIMSFYVQHYRGFFTCWQKHDRFVIYMAICDGLYNSCHLADHVNVLIVQDHVRPHALCTFYGMTIFVMISAQNLLVNVIAINTFTVMYFNYNLNLGKRDWRLLAWMFGLPMVLAVAPLALGRWGSNGAFCGLDGVTGTTFYLVLVAIPKIVILLTNVTLYLLTWLKLYHQVQKVKKTLGRMSAATKESHKAVKSMALFVGAYIIQWWALALSVFWAVIKTAVPQTIIQLVVFFSNIGGVLNLIVFIIIHRNRSNHHSQPAPLSFSTSN